MNIPDPAVYAALPIMGGMAMWIGRKFILDTTGRQGDPGPPGEPGKVASITVRDYKEITDVLRRELNGRYMLAKEAREHFASIEAKIELLSFDIHSHLSPQPRNPNGT